MSDLWQEQVKRDRDPALEEINRLALERIKELEEKIAQKYHLRLLMGTETESVFIDAAGKTVIAPPGDIDPAEYRPDLTMARASLLERVYVDTKHAHEFVTGYVPLQDGAKADIFSSRQKRKKAKAQEAHYRQPSYQARLADDLKVSLSSRTFPAMSLNGESHAVFSVDGSQDDYAPPTLAFQANISLWDKRGNNLCYKPRKDAQASYLWGRASALARICALGTLQVQKDTILLSANYPNSHEQFYEENKNAMISTRRVLKAGIEQGGDYESDNSVIIRGNSLAKSYRIENRLPRADSDPILGVLQSVAGVYHALETQTEISDHKDKTDMTHDYVRLDTNTWLKMRNRVDLSSTLLDRIGDHGSSHQVFKDSPLAKQLLGEELHAKITDYFSPEAVERREKSNARTVP